MKYLSQYASPLGGITMASDGKVLTGLWFDGQKYFGAGLTEGAEEKILPVFEETEKWLNGYFQRKEPKYLPPFRPEGSSFQKEVWEILLTIPYGETLTYGEIAKIMASRRRLPGMSAQAVGGAVGRNPISIIIPCHRVIGKNGSLTGYAGGIEKKERLLRLEKGIE